VELTKELKDLKIANNLNLNISLNSTDKSEKEKNALNLNTINNPNINKSNMSCNIDLSNFELCKQILSTKYFVEELRPNIEIKSQEDIKLLIGRYKKVNLDIQDYLISSDEIFEVISNIDHVTAKQEKDYNERLDKQSQM